MGIFNNVNAAVINAFGKPVTVLTAKGSFEIKGILDDAAAVEAVAAAHVKDHSHTLSVITSDRVDIALGLRTEVIAEGKRFRVVAEPEDDVEGMTVLPLRDYGAAP